MCGCDDASPGSCTRVIDGEEDHYGAFSVVPGTTFKVTMTGTGDADLYVKQGSLPTTSSYTCRPYLSGNNETCNIAAKTAATRMYVMLRGYSSYSSTSLKGTTGASRAAASMAVIRIGQKPLMRLRRP